MSQNPFGNANPPAEVKAPAAEAPVAPVEPAAPAPAAEAPEALLTKKDLEALKKAQKELKEKEAELKAKEEELDARAAAPVEGAEAPEEVGTLGDATLDRSVPMTEKGGVYLEALLKSPLVSAFIPSDILNEGLTDHVFCINSLRVSVPRGRMLRVPEMLANEIANKFGK